MAATIYLIPTVLAERKVETLPFYLLDAIKKCNTFYVENERTTRRFFKLLWREMVIEDYEWHTITPHISTAFKKSIQEEKTIGILSEAGCPGVADPGQKLVQIAQEMNADIKPLVGPSSILLALMGSGMNGQQFQFIGYLPIDQNERSKKIKFLESESKEKSCTQIFIETPYRNNQMLETILKSCHPSTRICLAVDLTADEEFIKTKTVAEWKKEIPQLHKRPAIFLLYAAD